MKTSLLAKSLPKYLAVAFSALVLGSVALITSALIHADAKASTSPSEQISETDAHEDDLEGAEDITDETDSDSDNSSTASEQSDAAQDQVASSNSTPQANTSTNTTSSTNPQPSTDSSTSQPNSGAQDQASASDNKEQQVAQAGETTASSPEATADATGDSVKDKDSDPISNPQLGYIPGAGKNHPGDKEGNDQDKNLLDLSDYYRQG